MIDPPPATPAPSPTLKRGAAQPQPLTELEDPSQVESRPQWRRYLEGTLGTIKMRLTILSSLVVLAAIAIITISAYATVRQVLDQTTNNILRSQAQTIADSSVHDTAMPVPGAGYTPEFQDVSNTMRLMVIPAEHTGPATNPSAFAGLLDSREIDVIQGRKSNVFHDHDEERIYASTAPDGRVIIVAADTSSNSRALETLALVLSLIAICSAIGAIVVTSAVVGTGLQPLARLRRATDRVTETGQLHQLSVFSQDEVGVLTQSFNNMMNALHASQEKQKELVADASHELKTPLTSLKTNIELLLLVSREDAPKIPEQDRKDLERDVLAQLEEMSLLIGDLVDLAREDGAERQYEPVDIEECLQASLTKVQRRRPDVNFAVHSQPWETMGDAYSLNRALLNLLDNAAKWSPDHATVRVWMEPIASADSKQPEAVEIRFADSGPGIPPEDREKVFDRFFRSIKSRSMPGSGLGLAIVKQVVESHGGAIVADESDDGGALIRLVLPGRPGRAEQQKNATGE